VGPLALLKAFRVKLAAWYLRNTAGASQPARVACFQVILRAANCWALSLTASTEVPSVNNKVIYFCVC
jgi:hypothetical protein